MTLLNSNTTPPGYPLTEQDLRAALPNVSFPLNPDDATLAPFGWHRVTPSPRPADARIERYDDTAQLIDGTWQQVWAARAATAEEQAAWDEAHAPAPDWTAFVLLASIRAKDFLLLLLREQPGLYGMITLGFDRASRGDTQLIFTALAMSRDIDLLAADLCRELELLAEAHHLPPQFCEQLELLATT